MYTGTGSSKFVLNGVDYEFSEIIEVRYKPKMEVAKIKAMDGTIREIVIGYYHNFDLELSLADAAEILKWKTLANHKDTVLFYPRSSNEMNFEVYIRNQKLTEDDLGFSGEVIDCELNAKYLVKWDIPNLDPDTIVTFKHKIIKDG